MRYVVIGRVQIILNIYYIPISLKLREFNKIFDFFKKENLLNVGFAEFHVTVFKFPIIVEFL